MDVWLARNRYLVLLGRFSLLFDLQLVVIERNILDHSLPISNVNTKDKKSNAETGGRSAP